MKRILCVCIGNSDRSPVMAAVLGMYLKEKDVICESAGIGEYAEKGGPASKFAVSSAGKIGLDISCHIKRRVTSLDLTQYDLFVCASDEIAGKLALEYGVPIEKLCNAQVTNPWPVQFEQDYETTMMSILGAMFKVVIRYF